MESFDYLFFIEVLTGGLLSGVMYSLVAIGFVLLVLIATTVNPSAAQDKPLLLRKPALSKDRIVFSFAGDLWSVPSHGGHPRRLTRTRDSEQSPRFAPDHRSIAFVASVLCPLFDSRIRTAAERHANLKRYVGRMAARYYPGWTEIAGCKAAA